MIPLPFFFGAIREVRHSNRREREKSLNNLYLFIYMCDEEREREISRNKRERNDEGEIKRMARIKGRH
jgi:hypothetical protein